MIPICTICRVPAPVARLAAAVFCGYAAIGAGIQILPEAARERFAASEWAIGATVTAASAAAVVARPLAGRRADERGPRGVVVFGALLASVGALSQLVAPSLVWLVAARLLIGAGEGALFTAAITWVLATAPVERRGRIVGHFGLSMWGGLALGPPLAAALAAATSTTAVWWACVLAPIVPALAIAAGSRPRRADLAPPSDETVDTVNGPAGGGAARGPAGGLVASSEVRVAAGIEGREAAGGGAAGGEGREAAGGKGREAAGGRAARRRAARAARRRAARAARRAARAARRRAATPRSAARSCPARRCGPGWRSRWPASATGRSTRSSCCASRRPTSAGPGLRWASSARCSCSRGWSAAR